MLWNSDLTPPLIPKSQKDGKNILYFTERGIQHISASRLLVCIPSTTNQFLVNIFGHKAKVKFSFEKESKVYRCLKFYSRSIY